MRVNVFIYTILKNNRPIGQAIGQKNAFAYIKKAIELDGEDDTSFGYWIDEAYIVDGKPLYKIERANNE